MNGIVRVVPRLDVKGPNVVKGIQFEGYRVLGTAEELAETYYKEGADELIFQDTVASLYQRGIDLETVRKTARRAFIPLTVAGGLRSIEDIRQVLRAGADKVAINTAAVASPELLRQASHVFGAQCVVASLEVFRQKNGRWEVWVDYGRQQTALEARAWAKQVVELGAGEIMLSSINNDGTGRGYDLELVREIATAVPVPVIACGGAGSTRDLVAVAEQGGASAVSAASLFHYHYTKPVTIEAMRKCYELRYGAPVDTGNVDFIHAGYGGIKEIQVKAVSIPDAKAALQKAGLKIRPSHHKPGGARA